MPPVAAHVPGVCAGAFVAIIPVTDLLNPAKARRRPTEQRIEPTRARGLKKADREADLMMFFILDFCFLSFVRPGRTNLSSLSYKRKKGARNCKKVQSTKKSDSGWRKPLCSPRCASNAGSRSWGAAARLGEISIVGVTTRLSRRKTKTR